MKYLNTLIFALIFIVICQTPLFAELVIDVDPPPEDDAVKKIPDETADDEETDKSDIIRFDNKDVLHGRMISIFPGKGILWKASEVKEDILFYSKHVRKIELARVVSKQNTYNTSVLLTNDDVLGGKLKSMDDEILILETDYAGILKIDSHMVQGVFPGEGNTGLLYSGPNDLSEWRRPTDNKNGTVSISDGVLSMSSYSAIGRDMKLADMSKIIFKYESSGNSQLQLLFYTDQVRSTPRNCYALYLQSGYIYLQRYGATGRSGNLGNVSSRNLRSGKGEITVLTDKKNKKITLLINGAIVKQWIDTEFPGKGTFVSFINQSQGTLKITDIDVSQWNGKIPGREKTEEASKEDSLIFINGDQVSGTLNKISDNIAIFKTDYAELKIPLKRIKQIKTAMDQQRKARRNVGDVRFSFANGDKLTLNLAKIADGKIIGKSENFGDASLKLNAFKNIELNIYDDDNE